jgi:hypothetical protein
VGGLGVRRNFRGIAWLCKCNKTFVRIGFCTDYTGRGLNCDILPYPRAMFRPLRATYKNRTNATAPCVMTQVERLWSV